MELQTIRQLAKRFGISTRTLRYYEHIGLLPAIHNEDTAYHQYDEAAILRLQQILILRQLRIPLQQIALLLENETAVSRISIFQQNLSEVTEEIDALSQIKNALEIFIDQLEIKDSQPLKFAEENLATVAQQLLPPKNPLHKEAQKMPDFISRTQKNLTARDVRIINLPLASVASIRSFADAPEEEAHRLMNSFVSQSQLFTLKPDTRNFGFDITDDAGKHGYEIWGTIPEQFELPAPFTKKQLTGGLYAAYMIPLGAFEEWQSFDRWLGESPDYAYRDGICFEEMLNWQAQVEQTDFKNVQLDLLLPIVKLK